MTRLLLFAHHLTAVFLLGAITHQAFSVCWPVPAQAATFSQAFRKVSGARFAVPFSWAYLLLMILGAWIYPAFRVEVRAKVFDPSFPWASGLFEIKEHFAAVGLGLLPVYLAVWKGGDAEDGRAPARLAVTVVLAAIVWLNFAVGHVLTNLKGL